ncbi:hypothetical protein KIPB_013919, partial [Kipferlia bialata]|eukprot:g13919.t1
MDTEAEGVDHLVMLDQPAEMVREYSTQSTEMPMPVEAAEFTAQEDKFLLCEYWANPDVSDTQLLADYK